MNQIERNTIRLYLLGRLDQEQLALLEERLFLDQELYDELLIAEDELTDEYLADELSEEDRRSVETHFLSSPERRQSLRFAQNLKRYVSDATSNAVDDGARFIDPRVAAQSRTRRNFQSFLTTNPILGYSLAAVILLGIIGVSWTVFNSLKKVQGPQNILLVSLTPGLTRDTGATTSIKVPPDGSLVQLQLALEANEYQSYRAELLGSERTNILVREDLKPESANGKSILNLMVSGDLLKRDDYRVKVSGRRPNGSYEEISSYTFRVLG